MEQTERKTKLWKMYENARSYQSNLRLTTDVPMYVDFYEGRQWPAKTERTKDIPRPVVNIVKFIVRNKKSSVVGSPVSIVFTSNKEPKLALKLTEFNKVIEAEMEMDEVRNRKVQDGIVKGTGIVHFYWDSEALGEVGEYEGGVRAEIIDPLNTFFANPQERDEQKQKWILIASRVEVSAAKAMMDEKHEAEKENVVEDEADVLYTDEEEQEGEKLVTVLTRYFRKNGEVYFERATKNVVLHEPKPMTPKRYETVEKSQSFGNLEEETEIDENAERTGEGKRLPHSLTLVRNDKVQRNAGRNDKETGNDEEDDGEDKLQDEAKRETVQKAGKKFRLYPIVVYNYEPREKSIYGMGEVEGVIPNQKAVNFNLAMQLLSIQNIAWDKWIVKPGALNGQKINNAPGQVLTDHTPNGVRGITRSEPPALSQAPMAFTDTLVSMTRIVTGSTEVMTGEAASSGQSGAAIANLQSQALKPIQELRDRYLRSCKKEAKIVKQFYELFYEGKPYEYRSDEGVIDETFNGAEYQDTMFNISVEAGAGTPYSESLMVQLLSEFLAAGYIDFSTYLELLPAQIATFKSSLKKQLEEGNIAKMRRLQEELTGTQEQLSQVGAYVKELQKRMQAQGKTVESANRFVAEIRRLNAFISVLQNEYTAKIDQANAINQAQANKNAELETDAKQMALMLAAETPLVEQALYSQEERKNPKK